MSTGCQKDRQRQQDIRKTKKNRPTDRQTERQTEDGKTFQLHYQNKSC